MSLREQAAAIQSREDLVAFLATLSRDAHHPSPDWWEQWQNTSVWSYLAAVASILEIQGATYEGVDEPVLEQPTWRYIGELLLAAKYQE